MERGKPETWTMQKTSPGVWTPHIRSGREIPSGKLIENRKSKRPRLRVVKLFVNFTLQAQSLFTDNTTPSKEMWEKFAADFVDTPGTN